MKAVAQDNAGGRLSGIGWGRGRGRALAFAYAALADLSSAVGADGAERGAWAPRSGHSKLHPPTRLCRGIREWSSCRAGGPRRRWPRGWFGLRVARAPSGRGSPLRGRSPCASPGGRPIGAAEAKDTVRLLKTGS